MSSVVLLKLIDELIQTFSSNDKKTPKLSVNSGVKNKKQNKNVIAVNAESAKENDDNQIVTSFKTSPTNIGQFFVPIIDISSLPLNESTLILSTVGVGNIAQISVDILLTTLISKQKVTKIGYICDRNVITGVGNDGFMIKRKKNKNRYISGSINTPVEVFWYNECKLVIIQQRCAIRIGGRNEYVEILMEWINKHQFKNIIILTSEYHDKRNDFQTKNGILFTYYHTEMFNKLYHNIVKQSKCNLFPSIKTVKKQINNYDDDQKECSEFDIIGGGISRKLYEECVKHKVSAITVCKYSNDGDNTEESIQYLNVITKLCDNLINNNIKPKKIKKWKLPYSLSFALGGKLPNGIY